MRTGAHWVLPGQRDTLTPAVADLSRGRPRGTGRDRPVAGPSPRWGERGARAPRKKSRPALRGISCALRPGPPARSGVGLSPNGASGAQGPARRPGEGARHGFPRIARMGHGFPRTTRMRGQGHRGASFRPAADVRLGRSRLLPGTGIRTGAHRRPAGPQGHFEAGGSAFMIV